MRARLVLLGAPLCFGLVPMLSAQDAVKADPQHYKVVSENAEVRVLKVHYGAHEKSVMHSHPDLVAVFLNDAKAKFTFSDGKTQITDVKAGDSVYEPAVSHLPENIGEKDMDIILVELKGKGAK
jgi:quercetin dioxygenase-like cupin family protein